MSLTISDNPADDTAAWMQNRLDGSIHPALTTDDPNIIYDPDKQAWSLLKEVEKPDLLAIYTNAEIQKQAFIRTVDSYNADARRIGTASLDIRAHYTWDDVLSLQRGLTEERDVKNSKGLRGFLHKGFRRVGDKSESFQAWLKLLPTQSQYLSVLCGGLTLLLGVPQFAVYNACRTKIGSDTYQAAHRMAEIRESIISIVDDIPRYLSRVEQYLEVFAESARLHECSAALYVAILGTLDAIVREFQKHASRRVSSSLFKQTLSGQDLLAKFKHIEVCADRLAIQANMDFMQRQKLHLDGTRDLTRITISSTRSQDYGFNTIAQRIHSQDRSIQLLRQTLNQCLSLLQASPVPLAIPTSRVEELGSEMATKRLEDVQSLSLSSQTAFGLEASRRLLQALLSHIDSNTEKYILARDVSVQLNLIYSLSLSSQDRAVALFTSLRVQDWLTSTSSSALLINGQMFSREYEARQSPLSYFCAKFVDGIRARPTGNHQETSSPVLVVSWFCGQHTNMQEDFDAHPPGLLNNLLSQLLHQLLENSLEATVKDLILPSHDLQLPDLYNIFMQLVNALPTGTILVCVIDGITYYEDADRRDECMEVLSMLTKLTSQSQDLSDGPLIKLLVTAPLRSHYVQRLFEEEDTMNMDEHYAPNGGFSALQWDLGVGSLLGE